MSHGNEIWGIVAEFRDIDLLTMAAERARAEGYVKLEAYSPFPHEGLSEALHYGRTWMAESVAAGALVGGLTAFGMQYYATVWSYPINVGGRPLNSWPVYMPVTFELTVLLAALTGLVAFLVLNGLPRLHHPLFNVPAFDRASQDGFFLGIDAEDPRFDLAETRRWLEGIGAIQVLEVPR